jgi:glucose-1-phosphate cytidylyltransferase
MLTYGDGVAAIDINKVLEFHRTQKKLATVSAVRPPARFGGISFNGSLVANFEEKPQIGAGWINGGFFVFESEIVNYIADDTVIWEREPMEKLAADGQLAAYRHMGFWQCVDTLRDVRLLDRLCREGDAPWKVWA